MIPSMAQGVYTQPLLARAGVKRSVSLLWALVAREIKGRYRRSLLGVLWAILPPVFYTVVFTFIQGILNIASENVPYVVFAYTAMVPWAFFSSAVSRCGVSISSNAGIVKKVAIPREVFPIAAVMTALVDFFISALILVGLLAWFHAPIGWPLVWLPVLVLLTTLLALGVGLLVGALGTFKQDALFAVPLLMQFWLLATPIMYPLGQVPDRWQSFYVLNPMVGIIEGFRWVMVKNTAPDLGLLGVSLLGTVLVWLVAWPLFRHLSQYFADVL